MDESALERLSWVGVLARREGGWRVSSARARAALEAATPAGRRAALHRACASALSAAGAPAEAVAAHLDASGSLSAALDVLLDGLEAATASGDAPRCAVLSETAARLVERLNLPDDAPRRARLSDYCT